MRLIRVIDASTGKSIGEPIELIPIKSDGLWTCSLACGYCPTNNICDICLTGADFKNFWKEVFFIAINHSHSISGFCWFIWIVCLFPKLVWSNVMLNRFKASRRIFGYQIKNFFEAWVFYERKKTPIDGDQFNTSFLNNFKIDTPIIYRPFLNGFQIAKLMWWKLRYMMTQQVSAQVTRTATRQNIGTYIQVLGSMTYLRPSYLK